MSDVRVGYLQGASPDRPHEKQCFEFHPKFGILVLKEERHWRRRFVCRKIEFACSASSLFYHLRGCEFCKDLEVFNILLSRQSAAAAPKNCWEICLEVRGPVIERNF